MPITANKNTVVVSSNRSDWIAGGIRAAAAQLQDLQLAAFDGPADLRALTALQTPQSRDYFGHHGKTTPSPRVRFSE
jgi:hypothetical protein